MSARAKQPASTSYAALDPRIARSRAAILAAASEHFLTNGYLGANVDDIAAEARVSKRTVYNIFGGKEQLFREILAEAFAVAERFSTEIASTLADTDDVAAELRAVAVTLVRTVLSGRVVRLRRLLIGEAERFPELARDYYARAPDRVMDALAEGMEQLGRRGLLAVDDPRLASEHLAFLILGAPLDRALFTASDEEPQFDETERRALEGVDVFLRAYGPGR
ncbi:TetR/AcrR family transcriptional regulator [Actinopolymorpha alba]|uniref:TetR/AcrR family transcriptional regulator n=1 Tax=Actinopolymorpha alba TaxID=533267 RepID=UPI0003700C57|nr:TetR/AcrR family transcriptional regulator [Actinopolymorpha alba]